MSTPAKERFAKNVGEPIAGTQCVLWLGGLDKNGYGQFEDDNGIHCRAHRFAWELVNGKIPDGLLVLHRCDVPQCVNLAHLFLGTNQDNVKDMMEKGRQLVGARNNGAKLNDEKVLRIRSRYRDGELASSLAREFGVSYSAIRDIVKRETWKNLP